MKEANKISGREIKRLGGKRWRALHRLAYVAAIAGVIHYKMQAKANVLRGRHRGCDPLQDAGESQRAPAAGVCGSAGRSTGIQAGHLLAPPRCRHTCSARLNANRHQSLNGHVPLKISPQQPYAEETTAL